VERTHTDRHPDNDDTAALLDRARKGHRSALDVLFARKVGGLRRWARGRLPAWARRTAETADLIQDAVLHFIARIDQFDARRKGALEAYLRQSIQNRVRDEIRLVGRRPMADDLDDIEVIDPQPSPLDATVAEENGRRYRAALDRLREADRHLIVGALELGYSHEQLALATGRPSAESARVALHRAMRRLADEMTRV
jgi:RNA polymerase sigma factor (sigma-70 family)